MMAKHGDVWMVLYDLGMRDEKLMYKVVDRLREWGYNAYEAQSGKITPDVVLGAVMKIRKFRAEDLYETDDD